PVPDKEARLKILKVHTRNMPLGSDVNLEKLAERMENYVGADIENVCREAGMFAIRENSEIVLMKHFEEALEKIPPSMTEESIKYYNAIGNLISKAPTRREELQYFR
ncbi:MAG: ATPase, partial [Thermoplasmata archaeon]